MVPCCHLLAFPISLRALYSIDTMCIVGSNFILIFDRDLRNSKLHTSIRAGDIINFFGKFFFFFFPFFLTFRLLLYGTNGTTYVVHNMACTLTHQLKYRDQYIPFREISLLKDKYNLSLQEHTKIDT